MIAKDLNKVVRKGDLTKIENYDKAISDETQTWICHHRLELTLDGEFAHSRKDLERMDMYYNRPYFELIFLTPSDHGRLHGNNRSEEHRKKKSEAQIGRKLSEETRKRISESCKGIHPSEETRKKMSKAHKGKKKPPLSKEQREHLKIPKSEFGKKFFEHYGFTKSANQKLYNKEKEWYYRNKKCRWE